VTHKSLLEGFLWFFWTYTPEEAIAVTLLRPGCDQSDGAAARY
jgi:hypothetical protein